MNRERKTVNVWVDLISYKPLDPDHLCKLLDADFARTDSPNDANKVIIS